MLRYSAFKPARDPGKLDSTDFKKPKTCPLKVYTGNTYLAVVKIGSDFITRHRISLKRHGMSIAIAVFKSQRLMRAEEL